MNARQVRPMMALVPAVTPWRSAAVVAAFGVASVGLAGPDPGSVVFKLRLAGAAVVAATACLLDDTATVTLASSPAPLAVRRGVRVFVAGLVVVAWWAIAAVLAGDAVAAPVGPAVARELAVLFAVAVAASFAAQRWTGDGRGGGAGAVVVLAWFALSLVPRIGRVPLPPQPLMPGSTGPVLAGALGAAAVALLLSRDPAAPRPGLRPLRRR